MQCRNEVPLYSIHFKCIIRPHKMLHFQQNTPNVTCEHRKYCWILQIVYTPKMHIEFTLFASNIVLIDIFYVKLIRPKFLQRIFYIHIVYILHISIFHLYLRIHWSAATVFIRTIVKVFLLETFRRMPLGEIFYIEYKIFAIHFWWLPIFKIFHPYTSRDNAKPVHHYERAT